MKVTVKKLTNVELMRWACAMTRRPGLGSKASYAKMLQCEHSPIRTQMYQIEIQQLPTFASVHHVRHHSVGGDYVQSMRDDRGGDGTEDRNTPVQHGSVKNAQNLIDMARKRLCYASHRTTVAMMTRIRKAVREADPDLGDKLVPECVYRNGLCPELRECDMGLEKVVSMYPKWPGKRL